jgi:hypothetical protein
MLECSPHQRPLQHMHYDSDMRLQYPIMQMVLLVRIYLLFYHLALGAYPVMHSVDNNNGSSGSASTVSHLL